MYNFIRKLDESVKHKTLTQDKLNYKQDDLAPSLSRDSVNFHYGKLYKGYVERYNKGEGDSSFNEAGAFLHSLYFGQFKPFKGSNKPDGDTADLINDNFKSWDKFTAEFEKEAIGIQGSGWIYLSKNGQIKTIKNHQIKTDILFLIDWWEHSWVLDYEADKKAYLAGQWKIIDWTIINNRIK